MAASTLAVLVTG